MSLGSNERHRRIYILFFFLPRCWRCMVLCLVAPSSRVGFNGPRPRTQGYLYWHHSDITNRARHMVTSGSVFVEAVEVAHTTGPMSRLSAAGTALKRGNIERLRRGEYAPAQRSVPPLTGSS